MAVRLPTIRCFPCQPDCPKMACHQNLNQLTLIIHALLRLPIRGMRGRVVRIHVTLVVCQALLGHTA